MGLDAILVGANSAQFAAQRLDMGVDGTLQTFAAVLPDAFHDLAPAENAARTFEKHRQQQVFIAGQIEPAAVVGNAQAVAVDGKARTGGRWSYLSPRFRAQSAQDGTDARHHLARAERLGYIVIAAQFEADDAVHLVGTRGQEKYGNVGETPQLPADIETAQIRQADVENNQIVIAAVEKLQRLSAEGAAIHRKAVHLQRIGQGFGNGGFVVDDENFHDDGNDNAFASWLCAARAASKEALRKKIGFG